MNNNIFKVGMDRNQFILNSLDSMVSPTSEARIVDVFVDTLDLSKFNFIFTSHKGNKSYSPNTLIKVLLLGYCNQIRSSRKLENALNVNVEFMWISNNLKIKHSTIASFRSSNKDAIEDIFNQYVLECDEMGIISKFNSIDGTKTKAVNSKDKNFTLNKLDYRIERIKKHIHDYQEQFDKNDEEDDLREELQNKINEYQQKIDEYEKLKQSMLDNNQTQISLTDPDARLMPNNGKFDVCYNNQVCVDLSSHIVKSFTVTNKPADVGQINDLSLKTKNLLNQDIVVSVTDKGYNDRNDMANCLENGIIPEVTPTKGKDSFTVEIPYVENDISSNELLSTENDDISKCLRAGVIPDVYKDKISSIEIKEVTEYDVNPSSIDDDDLSLDQKRDLAMNNNCFVRDLKENVVFCPLGEMLRKKSTNAGKSRYCNKFACKNCKNPCTKSKYKSVDFSDGQTIVNNSKKKRNKKKKIKVKKVFVTLKCNFDLLKLRMSTSEHPHGSQKFWDNSGYLLCKGIDKVTAEMSLYYCAYNIRRSINLLGFDKVIEHFKKKKADIINNISTFCNNFLYFVKNNVIYHFFMYI